MRSLQVARNAGPGRWLLAAIVCDLLTYATAVERLTGGIALWIAVDLWLAHRIWKGGAVALAAFRLLEGFGLLLFGVAVILAAWTTTIETTATPLTVALFGGTVWCLMAPALSTHVSHARGIDSPTQVRLQA